MEIIQLPFNFSATNFLLFASFIISSLIIIKLWKITKSPPSYQSLPPSPPKLPLIGHLHHLLGGLPHHALRRLTQTYGPVLHLRTGQVSMVVISSRQAARQVLKNQDPACADRPQSIGLKIMWYNYANIAFSPYNEYWRQMRKICILELLSAKNVRSFGPIRQDEASRLLKSLRPGQAVDLTDKINTFISAVTCRATFGKVVRDREALLAMLKKAVVMAGGFDLADFFPSSKLLYVLSWNRYKLLKMRRKVDEILDGIVDEYKSKQSGDRLLGDEDILDVLLRMQKNKELEFPITNDTIKAVIFDMFSAGTETSSTLLDWTMAELMRNPVVMAKAQAEIREAFNGKKTIEESDIQALKYLKLVIKETLRLHPPSPLLLRACRDECKVDGYSIPLKSKVLVNIWAMGRDPEYWPEPEIFRPERFENNVVDILGNHFEYIPFGSGKRICPGIGFAFANVELPLALLLYHFDWEMPKGMKAPDDIDMTEVAGISSLRKDHLFLVPIAYECSLKTSILQK